MVWIRRQFTHPDSNDLPTTFTAPFNVRSKDLEACTCQEYNRHKCSYHEILKVNPAKRTKAMKAVIESQHLAFEAGRLLLSTRAYTQQMDMERLSKLRGRIEASEEAIVMEKSIVAVIKAALLHDGTCAELADYPCIEELDLRLQLAGLSHGFDRPLESNETPLDRARSLSWLHLLAAVPLLMAHVSSSDAMRLTAAVRTASIALALMEHGSKRWKTLMEAHGLSLWDYELVVRMHQSMAIHMMSADLPRAALAEYARIYKANTERIYSVQPINYWNLMFCLKLDMDKGHLCQVLRKALKVATEEGDHSASICLRWELCHAILLGAEGPSFAVDDVSSIIKRARTTMGQLEKWTEPTRLLLEEVYWACMGVAAKYRAAMKKDPSFVHSMMKAYASVEDLESEKRHVMCAFCDEMCCPLQKCSGCQNVGYCSKDCQKMDWKAGHKHECKQHSKPDGCTPKAVSET